MRSRPRALAWGLAGASVALGLVAAALALANPDRSSVGAAVLSHVGSWVFSGIGALIAVHRPANPIGWILIAVGLLSGLEGLAREYAWYSVAAHRGRLPLTVEVNWVWSWVWAPALALVAFYTVILFPGGRLPSRRWRPVAWGVAVGTMLLIVATTLDPSDPDAAFPGAPASPFAPLAHAGISNALAGIATPLYFLPIPAAAVSLIRRLRRARGEERRKIAWFVYGGALMTLAILVGVGFDAAGYPTVRDNVIYVGVFALPVAAGIAILRGRLYDIDVVVSKTVVVGLMAAFITIVYMAVVVGVGTIVGTRRNPVLSAAATAVVAIAFQPVRRSARRVADRLVYGKRATPYEVLSGFSERLGEAYSVDDVLPRLARVLGEGVGAERVTVWLRGMDGFDLSAAWPDAADPSSTDSLAALPQPSFEVRHQGDLLGAISVEMPTNEPLAGASEKLAVDVATQAGLVVRNVRLVEELRASRQRLVAAQDEERRKIERNLHDGAQQRLVALTVKARLARSVADRDVRKVGELLEQIEAETHSALEDLRDLARGIYPPLLADQGLPAALEAQARKSPVPVEVDPDSVGRYAQEIESAVYFCTLEALQNVAKYARATSATITLAATNGELRFEIRDDGVGFDPATTRGGTGLQGMADRVEAVGGSLEVRSGPGEGTTVFGRVPIR